MSKLYDEIAERIGQNLPNISAGMHAFIDSMPFTKAWIEVEWPLSQGLIAQPLLSGAKQALLDTGAAWAIGLNRGAVAALRTVIESSIAWVYYKDHPVEFKQVSQHRENMLLPKAVQTYALGLSEASDKIYKALSKNSARDEDYYYTTVSAYVHAHPAFSIAALSHAEMAVSTPPPQNFLTLSAFSDEFISDIYLSHYIGSWGAVPEIVKANAAHRLGNALAKLL